MTHADRAYTAPQELADIRKEFKPNGDTRCVDGVEYAAGPSINEGDNLCEGCAAEKDAPLCVALGNCTKPQVIFVRRP
jgi:hypothetical protein